VEKDINVCNASLASLHHERQICQSKKYCGVLRGIRPLSAFSSPILCGKAKNGQMTLTERAKLGEAVGEDVENLVFLISPRLATTSGRQGKRKSAKAILLWWRRRGRGPHFLRELFYRIAHSLPHTEVEEVERASAPFSSCKVFGGVGTFFKKSPRRSPASSFAP
jgi:hypothetical protein